MTVLAELLDAVGDRARVDPDAVLPVLELLAAPDASAASGVVGHVETHAAARQINAERLARDEQQFRAGALTTAQVRERLGVSRQAIHARREAGGLLAAMVGSRWLYPGWQFSSTGLVAGLPEVLTELRDLTGDDARQADAIMRAAQPDLAGSASLAALLTDGQVDAVVHRLTARADQS